MSVSSWSWESVVEGGMGVPRDRSLADLTAELGAMLGDPDPDVRTQVAHPVLSAWVAAGVYDDLLRRLGGGLLVLLEEGVGDVGDDGVFRRSWAAAVLAEVLERDHRADLLDDRTVRSWGDRLAAWFLAEQDLRGWVPDKGWAHAITNGATAIGALARSPRLHGPGLVFLLDVLATRVLTPTPEFLVAGEADALALAAMDALRRDLVTLGDLDPWLARLADRARPDADDPVHPYRVNGNVQAFLRAFHLQLALAPERPGVRPDLLLSLFERLRATNPDLLRPHGAHRVLPRRREAVATRR